MLEDYKNALKSGQRAYRACVARGQSPYLAVLDDILVNVNIVAQEPLGLAAGVQKQTAQAPKNLCGYGRGSKFRTHGTRFWRPLLYQLSYTPMWSCYPDSNWRPHPYQGCALPTEL